MVLPIATPPIKGEVAAVPHSQYKQQKNMKNLVLKDEQVFSIRKVGERAYKSEKPEYKGKNFMLYSTGRRGFTVPLDDPFNSAFEKAELAEVHLIETNKEEDPTVMQLSLSYFVTQDQMINMASYRAKLDSIKAGEGKASQASLEELEKYA